MNIENYPTLNFSQVYSNDDDNSVGSFDVYAAANSQRKSRQSVENPMMMKCSTIEIATHKPFQLGTFEPKPKAKAAKRVPSTQFKAKPLNRKIFESAGELGVPKVPPKALTEPQPFQFNTERRISARSASASRGRKSDEEMEDKTNTKRSRSCSAKSVTASIAGAPAKLTVPQSPALRTSKRFRGNTTNALSSEDLEMQRVAAEVKAEQAKMEEAKKLYARVKTRSISAAEMTGHTASNNLSAKELTIPVSPIHHLNARLGKKQLPPAESGGLVAAVVSAVESTLTKLTQVLPFQFETDKRARARGIEPPTPAAHSEAASLTFGELVQNFVKDPRSHYVPVNAATQITEPKTPELRTLKRARGASRGPPPKSREELEKEAMEALQRKKFKAKGVNRKVLESTGELGVPKIPPKPLTEPTPFKLSAPRSIRAPTADVTSSTSSSSFKALPLPNFAEEQLRSARQLAAAHQPPKLTVPESPKLSGINRASSAPARRQLPHHSVVEQQQQQQQQQILQQQQNQQQSLLGSHVTEPHEFHLRVDARGAAYRARLEERLRAEEAAEAAARIVHAQPAPVFEATTPRVQRFAGSTPTLTQVQEFNLASVTKHVEAQRRFAEQVDRSVADENAKAVFHARAVPKSLHEPPTPLAAAAAVPGSSPRPPLRAVEPNLQSAKRAEKRKEFDEHIAAKWDEIEQEKERVFREKLDSEMKAIKEYRRKSCSFKATPIMTEDPLPVKAVASQPLTEPKSPYLRTAKRARVSSQL